MACFPEKLIDGVVRDGRIWPRYLTERDAPWVEALQDFLLAQVGQRRQEMEQQLGQQLARGRAGRRAKAALAHLLVQLHGFD
ncbi:MAG: hypothetical protein FJ125_15635, partial [Deltaproteobacteria bacterium]|nr:hypothetical protein [Deltaproteobacteria bacterium]